MEDSQKMRLNITKIVPKEWIITKKNNKIVLFYKNKRPQNNPKKKYVTYKWINLDNGFYEGLGLFLGDADLNRKEKRHLTFVSIDKDIASYALNFLKRYFNVKLEDITFLVQYNKTNKNLFGEWSSYLKIPKNKILTRYSSRHKEEAIHIQVNGVVFRKTFELIIKEALSNNFLSKKSLRRSLLRGLFATEGNIGIDYIEKKPYISQITFNLHINEDHIKYYICDILNIEEIGYTINKNKKDNSLLISIYGWDNYWKLWKCNLFNLCERKKKKFLNIMKDLKVYCILKSKDRIKLFNSLNIKQKEIAELIGSWQGNVSKIMKGTHNLTIEQLYILLEKSNFDLSSIINNIKLLRVGNLTHMRDASFKRYMFSLKIPYSLS